MACHKLVCAAQDRTTIQSLPSKHAAVCACRRRRLYFQARHRKANSVSQVTGISIKSFAGGMQVHVPIYWYISIVHHSVYMPSKDWRCRTQVTPARVLRQAYVACLEAAPVLFAHAIITVAKNKTIRHRKARLQLFRLPVARTMLSIVQPYSSSYVTI